MNARFIHCKNPHSQRLCPLRSVAPGWGVWGEREPRRSNWAPLPPKKEKRKTRWLLARAIKQKVLLALLAITALNSCARKEILVSTPCALPMPTQTRAVDIVQDLKNTLIYCQELETTLKACKGLQ